MITLSNETEILTNNKIKLTVPIVANLLSKGFNQSQIAKTCNITVQSVNGYIKRNYDRLLPLFDTSDRLLATKAKDIANQAYDKLDDIFKTTDTFDKRDIASLNILAGTQVDKHRLMSDRSTANLSIDQATTNANEAEQQIIDIQAQIDKLKAV